MKRWRGRHKNLYYKVPPSPAAAVINKGLSPINKYLLSIKLVSFSYQISFFPLSLSPSFSLAPALSLSIYIFCSFSLRARPFLQLGSLPGRLHEEKRKISGAGRGGGLLGLLAGRERPLALAHQRYGRAAPV